MRPERDTACFCCRSKKTTSVLVATASSGRYGRSAKMGLAPSVENKEEVCHERVGAEKGKWRDKKDRAKGKNTTELKRE